MMSTLLLGSTRHKQENLNLFLFAVVHHQTVSFPRSLIFGIPYGLELGAHVHDHLTVTLDLNARRAFRLFGYYETVGT